MRRGLTLVELLIAASIFSAVTVSIYAAFSTGVLSYRKLDASFEVYQGARVVLNRLESDLRQAFAYRRADSAFQASRQKIDFLTTAEEFAGSNKSYPVVRRIIYEARAKTLERSCYAGLDALRADAAAAKDNLGCGLNDVSFEYAAASLNNGEPFVWQQEWPLAADAQQKAGLPLAVKVKLTLEEKQAGTGQGLALVVFTKIIPLALSQQSLAGAAPGAGPPAEGEPVLPPAEELP
jgi:prepilin-type N-terminal cleavage/methylation domain-containing protein